MKQISLFDRAPILLTIPEAAAQLGIGRTHLYELIGAGELEVIHIGRSVRVPVDAIEKFVEACRTKKMREERGRVASMERRSGAESAPVSTTTGSIPLP